MKFFLLVGGAAIITMVGAAESSLAQNKRGAAPARSQPAAGPTATYWMSAETATGMSAMAAGGMPGMAAMSGGATAPGAAPQRPGAGAVIGGLLGRGGGLLARGGGLFGRKSGSKSTPPQAQASRAAQMDPVVHQLLLQLGSRNRAPSTPNADHFVPPSLQAGQSLPLVTPESAPPTQPGQFERPKGKILLYWGCGERARAGQPVTIDFSKIAAGQMPPGLSNGPQIRAEQPPTLSRFPGYGEWPNKRQTRQFPGTASLVGNHVVRGNYSPEISFALATGQDFLGPLRMTANSAAPSGAVPLRWQSVPNATAYHALVTGSASDGTLVMWSSSESQMFGMAYDYLSGADAARLVQARVLMSPATTSCTVPAEVQRSVQGAMLMMTAYGPETNLSQPKPATAPVSWRPDWTVKLRTRSSHSGMLGMDMAAMMRGE
ncbi:hypothetical protein [Sphingomonas sp. LHG3406-1]|uniref:hypothetical protein n=1 Tax=Sphingomonas sp. LHG3406-1 TaxID=2804617 RepID=UPI0026376AC9|nr:hypothetical protein [Sphingomonas sp. LHG3406-1]